MFVYGVDYPCYSGSSAESWPYEAVGTQLNDSLCKLMNIASMMNIKMIISGLNQRKRSSLFWDSNSSCCFFTRWTNLLSWFLLSIGQKYYWDRYWCLYYYRDRSSWSRGSAIWYSFLIDRQEAVFNVLHSRRWSHWNYFYLLASKIWARAIFAILAYSFSSRLNSILSIGLLLHLLPILREFG